MKQLMHCRRTCCSLRLCISVQTKPTEHITCCQVAFFSHPHPSHFMCWTGCTRTLLPCSVTELYLAVQDHRLSARVA